MDLKVPIVMFDEFGDEVVKSSGLLDLASGEIHEVRYEDYDAKAQGVPAERDDYDFTSGMLSNAGKDVEFRVEVDLFSGRYSVSANELLEIKLRAAKLFAGLDGKQLLAGAPSGNAPALAAKKAAGGARSGGGSARAATGGPRRKPH